MKIIQRESDFQKLRADGNVDSSVLSYIQNYFEQFASKTEHELSIEDVGMIVILEKCDQDIFTPEMPLPSLFRSVPEETRLIHLSTPEGKQIELIQTLFLPNNEMGIDLFGVRGEISEEINRILSKEL